MRFRPPSSVPAASQLCTDLLAVSAVIDDALHPGHFYAAPALPLDWTAARAEKIPWEIFRGTLVDRAQTRAQRSFVSWGISVPGASEPLVSVKLDPEARCVHVCRALLVRAWEPYEEGGAILSRAAERWQRELVGSIDLWRQVANVSDPTEALATCRRTIDLDELRDELIRLVWQAVVGTSRLPLTSIEAPLPAFSLGQLAYVYRAGAAEESLRLPLRTAAELLEHGLQPGLAWREEVKLVEAYLRATPPEAAAAAATQFAARWRRLGRESAAIPRLLRALFNDVSLSPYTDFVATALRWLQALVAHGAFPQEGEVDFLSYLLRQLGRHLAAYDLDIFHHRGANYPDALLLDAVLRRYLTLGAATPALFHGATPQALRRRRALRQGALLRRHYEGQRVPDVPTSPGENARVVPGVPHLSDEQLLQPLRRTRRLYEDEPTAALLGSPARELFAASLRDLDAARERAELGMALFIDRPLGYAKLPGEPDQTPLLAHECYSAQLAARRWQVLSRLAAELELDLPALAETPVTGLPHAVLATPQRPTACLADVRRVAADFVVVRTLPGGLRDLACLLQWPAGPLPRLCLQVAHADGPRLTLYDDRLEPRQVIQDESPCPNSSFSPRSGA
jgi:hypothetical protein